MSKSKYTLYRYTHVKAISIFSVLLALVGMIGITQYGLAAVIQ